MRNRLSLSRLTALVQIGCHHEAYMKIQSIPMPFEFILLHLRGRIHTTQCFVSARDAFIWAHLSMFWEVEVNHPFLTSLIWAHHLILCAFQHVPFGYPLVHPCDTTVATYKHPTGAFHLVILQIFSRHHSGEETRQRFGQGTMAFSSQLASCCPSSSPVASVLLLHWTFSCLIA